MRRSAFDILAGSRVLEALAVSCLFAAPALADVALLKNGRTLSVAGYRMVGDQILLVMEGGGQIALPNGQVLAIRRERAAPAPDAPPPGPPAAGPAPAERAALEAPVATALSVPEGRRDGDGPIAIDPGAVFDRDALRGLASRIARKHAVDERLVLAVIEVESRYDAFAVSPRGAMGLMQLMPQTAARFAVGNLFNPVENVDGGVRYLKELLARYSGQVRLALAAYNAGEDAVDQFKGIPPFRETQQYVVRVLRALPR